MRDSERELSDRERTRAVDHDISNELLPQELEKSRRPRTCSRDVSGFRTGRRACKGGDRSKLVDHIAEANGLTRKVGEADLAIAVLHRARRAALGAIRQPDGDVAYRRLVPPSSVHVLDRTGSTCRVMGGSANAR